MIRTSALAATALLASLTGCALAQQEFAPATPAPAPAPAPAPVVVAAPPTTAAPTTTTQPPKPATTSLYWIGDSVSYFSEPLLSAALPAGSIVNADPGRGMLKGGNVTGENMTWVAGQRAVKQLLPGGWLVVQGSVNDNVGDLPTVAKAMQSIVDALPDDRCLAYQPPYRGDMPVYQEWAETLVPIAEQQPCHKIINGWREANEADPTLTYDTVHPTEAGKSAFADVAREAFAL